MVRVAIIGIDGMDADLLRVYGPSLPNLRRLMLESPFLELKSSFPPEAAAAWTSIYTGLNPANHGILNRIDCTDEQREGPSERAILSGQTFWDYAGQAGKRVCVVNPYLAYPSWPVNGTMLSLPPLDIKGEPASIIPEETDLSAPFPSLLDNSAAPTIHQLGDFYRSLAALSQQQAALGLELFQREPWDLFFMQLDALDHVQHLFWRYSDPSDPTYPGRNEHASRIYDFYRLCDQIIGQFRSYMPPDCILMIVSSYGHGRKCIQWLNLNEWLSSQGLLVPHLRSVRLLDRHYLAERAKTRSLELLAQFRLQDTMPHIAQHLRSRQRQQRQVYIIDQDATIAQVVDIAGISPFGGIGLNRARIERDGYDYEQLQETLLEHLAQLRPKGRTLVHWAKRRENVYQGKYIQRFPDILFELQSDIGVSENLCGPLVTPNISRRVISGAHRMHGVLLLGNLPKGNETIDDVRDLTVMDVAPTIYSLLGIMSAGCDGKALIISEAVKQ